MFESNVTQFLCFYCSATRCDDILIDRINTCTTHLVLTMIHLGVTIAFAYLAGVLPTPDDLDRRIRTTRRSIESRLMLILTACTGFTICAAIFDFIQNYCRIVGIDSAGLVFFICKMVSFLAIIVYSVRSFMLFDSSLCRVITVQVSNLFMLFGLGLQSFWFFQYRSNQIDFAVHPTAHRFLLHDQVFVAIQFALIALHSIVGMWLYASQRRHSLYYESFADNQSDDRPGDVGNADSASLPKHFSIWSRLTFGWVRPLLKKALDNRLKDVSDIFPLPRSLTTVNVMERIQRYNRYDNDRVRLMRLLWRTFGRHFLFLGIVRLTADSLAFAAPLLLNQLIKYVEAGQPTYEGFFYAGAICLSQIVSALLVTHFDLQSFRVGIQMRAATFALLQQKLLRTGVDRLAQSAGSGRIMTLAGVDTDRVMGVLTPFFMLISQPFQIFLALYLLYRQLGIGSIAGVAFAVLILPINKFVCDLISRLTTKQLKHKDLRVRATTQLLSCARVVRANAIQDVFRRKIEKERDSEMSLLKKRKYLDAVCVYFWATTPLLVSLATFGTCALWGERLTAASVFTSMTLLNMLIVPLNSLPWILRGLVETVVSLRRLQAVFNLKSNHLGAKSMQVASHESSLIQEHNSQTVRNDHQNDFSLISNDHKIHVYMQNVTLKRDVDGHTFEIGPFNLKITQAMLVGVVGPIGSGKSSLLQALAGEFKSVDMNGLFGIQKSILECGIGYVSQQSWIQNASIRNNILFGKNFEYRFYNDVLDACALRPDLAVYEEYDLAMVGEGGAALSGGQKARIALARAVYQNLDMYLMDEPFSALDVNVADHIHNHVLCKVLAGKTRIVCTHQHRYLRNADLVIRLDQGKVVAVGRPEEVLQSNGDSNTTSQVISNTNDSDADEKSKHKMSTHTESQSLEEESVVDSQFQEERGIGYVPISVYFKYGRSIGPILCAAIAISFAAMQITRSFADLWLSVWVNALTDLNVNQQYYVRVLALIVVINSVLAVVRAFLYAYGNLVAAERWHRRLLDSVLNTKLSFFDQRPFGQLINRFSSDTYQVDEQLPFTLNLFLTMLVSLLASVAVATASIWPLLFVFILLTFPYLTIQRIYRAASSDLKRICSITLSPVYSILSETLNGLTTIRCFRAEKRFSSLLNDRVDMNHAAQYCLQACSQWLVLRLQLLALLVSSAAAFVAAFQYHVNLIHVPVGAVGLALAYSLSLCTLLNGVLHMFTQVEMDLVSVERLDAYIEHDQHEPDDGEQLEHFPLHGSIEFKHVQLMYGEKQNAALSDISFSIKSKEFVGIVGRTGAGKSSLLHVLLRLYEASAGQIEIDGHDIRGLHLKTLRSGICVIAQDGCLFDANIRTNLDPESEREDHELWRAIDKCGVRSIIVKLGGLDGQVGDRGMLLSAGERQLLCLVRALIQKSRIVCLDEATSAMDKETEVMLQNTLRRSFRHSTVLLIAHRLHSVLNCDRVLVMDGGVLVEMDAPDKLIQNPRSLFFRMWSANEHKFN